MDDPGVRQATGWLSDRADRAGLGGPFVPNEVTYHRLSQEAADPGPRRSARYHSECVAVVTLRGRASFTVYDEHRRDVVVDSWQSSAGQVVLLRGWSPLGFLDPRPYLRIRADRDRPPLLALARHNLAAPGGDPMSWLGLLTRVELDQARSVVGITNALRSGAVRSHRCV